MTTWNRFSPEVMLAMRLELEQKIKELEREQNSLVDQVESLELKLEQLENPIDPP